MKTTIAFLLAFLLIACDKHKVLDPVNNQAGFHGRGPGASAGELLKSDPFESLRIQVQYMPGFAPDAAAINNLKTFLSARINKPDGIHIVSSQIAASGQGSLSASEVLAIELNNRNLYSSQTELVVYILYTDGQYTQNNVLGIAHRNTSIALFGKTIHDNSGGIGQTSRTKLETTVLEHELGHLLGLVDIGTPMQTQHKANGNHCSNSSCLMYYASETTDILGFLITGSIPPLDADCINDLRANGGK